MDGLRATGAEPTATATVTGEPTSTAVLGALIAEGMQ